MPHKIALNGFGRLGKLAIMAQTIPLMPPKAREVFEEGIESLKEAINEADERRRGFRMFPTDDAMVFVKKPEFAVTDVKVDDMPKARYHSRIFSKDYFKKKKAKRRNQKQSRKRTKR